MNQCKQVIMSNGTDTVVLREALNDKGHPVIISVVNGIKRVRHCTSLDIERDVFFLALENMKVVDQMTFST